MEIFKDFNIHRSITLCATSHDFHLDRERCDMDLRLIFSMVFLFNLIVDMHVC